MVQQEGKLTELRELFTKLDMQFQEMNNVQEVIKEKLKN